METASQPLRRLARANVLLERIWLASGAVGGAALTSCMVGSLTHNWWWGFTTFLAFFTIGVMLYFAVRLIKAD